MGLLPSLSPDPPRRTPRTVHGPGRVPPQCTIHAYVLETRDIYMNIYMFANHSSQQGVPCLWLALGKASLTPRHGITFVPLREVGRPRPSTHRWHCMLSMCLHCVKLTVRDPSPYGHAQLGTRLGCFFHSVLGCRERVVSYRQVLCTNPH